LIGKVNHKSQTIAEITWLPVQLCVNHQSNNQREPRAYGAIQIRHTDHYTAFFTSTDITRGKSH